MKAYFEHYENQKKVSLNQEKRQIEIQTMRSQRLAIENRLRKSRGQSLLNNLDELEEINNQKLEQKKKDREPDAFLQEAGAILTDMVRATNNKQLFTRRYG